MTVRPGEPLRLHYWVSGDRALHRDLLNRDTDFIAEFTFKDRLHPFTVFALRPDLLPGVGPGGAGARVAPSGGTAGHHR